MNNVFRLIWNRTLGRLVVASEAARSRDKAATRNGMVGQLPAPQTVGPGASSLLLRPLALAVVLAGAIAAPSISLAYYWAGGGTATGNCQNLYNYGTPDNQTHDDPNSGGGDTFYHDPGVGGGASSDESSCSIAIGNNAYANQGSIALGDYSTTELLGIAIGDYATAGANGAVALGMGAAARGLNSLAIMRQSSATGDYALGIGTASSAQGDGAVVVGKSGLATGYRAIAIGSADPANGNEYDDATNTQATGDNSIAIGSTARAADVQDIAIGYESYAEGGSWAAIAVGSEVTAIGKHASAFGDYANASANFTTALGNFADASANNATAVGNSASASGEFATVMGNYANASADFSTALGNSASASVNNATAVGNSASASDVGATALGNFANAEGANATALGGGSVPGTFQGAQALADGATAIGGNAVRGARAEGIDSIAMGGESTSSGTDAIAIGTNAQALSQADVAMGRNASVDGTEDGGGPSIGLGAEVAINASSNATAVGTGASIGTDTNDANGATAVGNAAVVGGDSRNATAVGNRAGIGDSSWNSVAMGSEAAVGDGATNAVAIGGEATVADGATASIAMGYKATTASSDAIALGREAQATGVQSISIGTEAAASADDAVAMGTGAQASGERSIAIGDDAIATGSVAMGASARAGNGGAAFGDGAVATYNGGTTDPAIDAGAALGENASADVSGATALGTDATVTHEGSVALGQGSIADGSTLSTAAYQPLDADGTPIAVAASTAASEVSVGSAGNERRITNVAAGATDTDAVNVSQLKAVEQVANTGWNVQTNNDTATNVAPGDTVQFLDGQNIDITRSGTDITVATADDVAFNQVTIGDATDPANSTVITNAGDGLDVGGDQITNVQAGDLSATSTDAVNGSQLFATNQNVATNTTNITNNANEIAKGFNISADNGTDDNVQLGDTVNYTSGDNNIVTTVTDNQIDFGLASSIDVGSTNTVTIDGGAGTVSGLTNTTFDPNATYTGGQAATQEQLTSVSDVANKGWNVQANSDAATNVAPGDTVQFVDGKNIDITRSGTDITVATADDVEFNQVTLGDTTNNTVLTSTADGLDVGGDKITNVQAGDVSNTSTDAVNGSQLFATNQNVTKNAGDIANNTTKINNNTTEIAKGFNISADNGTDDNVQLGDTVNYTSGDNNIVTTVTDNQIDFGLASSIDVGSTNTVTIDGDAGTVSGLTNTTFDPNATYTGGQAATQEQLTSVSGVANKGWNVQANSDAATNVAPGDTVKFVDGKNIDITRSGTDITVATADDVEFNQVTIGDTTNNTVLTSTADGLDVGGDKITNVQAGDVSNTSTDAVNGSQLFATNQNVTKNAGDIANNTTNITNNATEIAKGFNISADNGTDDNVQLGDTVNYTSGDNNIVTTVTDNQIDFGLASSIDVGSTNTVTIDGDAGTVSGLTNTTFDPNATYTGGQAATQEQLTSVSDVANKGWNVQANSDTATNVAPGDTVKFVDGKNIDITRSGTDITVATADDVEFNQVTIGDTTNNTVLTSTADGLDVGGDKITNVQAGDVSNTSTDAVNGSQLFATNQNVATNTTNITNNANEIAKGFNISADNGTDDNVQLGDTVNYTSSDNNIVTTVTDNQIDFGLASSIDVGSTNTVTIDGDAGTVSGLTNTTFDPNATYTGGQAATQEQLTSVSDVANKGWNVQANSDAATNVAPGDTVQFVDGKNIDITRSGTDITVATADDVNFTNVNVSNNLDVDGNTYLGDDFSVVNNEAIYNVEPNQITNDYSVVNKKYIDGIETHYYSVNDGGIQQSNYSNDGAQGVNSLAAGTNALTESDRSVALGDGATTQVVGFEQVAIGHDAVATGNYDIAIGSEASGSGAFGVSVGHKSSTGTEGVAIGQNAKSTERGATALGQGAMAGHAGSVALGQDSVADGSTLAASPYQPLDANNNPIAVAAPTAASEVSVGSAGNERRITNVAAGAEDTDAVNVSQLKAVNDVANAGWDLQANSDTATNVAPGDTVQFVDGKNIDITRSGTDITVATADDVEFNQVTIGDTTNNTVLTSTADGLDVGGDKITNVQAGDVSNTSTDAVNGSQLFATNQNVTKNAGDIANNTTNITNNANEIAKGFNISADNGTDDNVQLGDTVNYTSGDNNIVTTVTDNQIDFGLASSIDVGSTNTVTIDGDAGTVSGLTNTTFDPNATYTGGQAATQEQLTSVSDVANKGWNVQTTDDTAAPAQSKVAPSKNVDFVSSDNNVAISHSQDANGDTQVDYTLSNALTVGEAGPAGEDGYIGVDGKDGVSGVAINGKDGSIGLTGPSGANGTISVIDGVPGVDGKDGITRIVIDDIEVATMEDGLKFAGNTGDTIAKKLNETLNIEGELADADDASGANLRVDSDGTKLNLVMAKNLTELDSATFGEPGTNDQFTINKDGVQFVDATGDQRADTPSITSTGIDGGDNQITGVGSGLDGQELADITGDDLNNAVNVGDLQDVSTAGNGGGFGLADASDAEVKQDLGATIKVHDPDGNIVTVADNATGELQLGLSNDLTVGEAGPAGEDGYIGVDGKDGVSGVAINGKDGSIGLTGPSGANGTISVIDGVPGVDGKDGITRIVIDDIEVATMEDGLKFAGNTGDTIAKKLNETLNIEGELADADDASGANLRVDSDGTKLNLVMAKNLTELDSATFGEPGTNDQFTINKDGVQFVDATGDQRADTPSITSTGIDGGDNQITGVGSGLDGQELADITGDDLNNAVNVGDLQDVSTAGNGGGFGLADASDAEVKQDLGATIKVHDPDGNIVTVADNATGELQLGLSNDLTVGEAGPAGEDGYIGVDGKDGVSGVAINGKDGSIGLTGPSGANGTISVIDGVPGVDGKDGITRIVIDDIEVATMEDGLKFAGNTGDTIAKKLNETLNIEGELADADDASGANLRVDSDGTKLNLVMAKNLTELDSATFGEPGTNDQFTINKDGVQFVDATGDQRADTPSITSTGIDGGDNQITGVGSGLDGQELADITGDDLNNAVNVGDLQDVSTAGNGGGFGLADASDAEVKQDLGATIKVHDPDGNIVTVADNATGELQLGLSNDLTVGEAGPAGEDGYIGVDGKDGVSGVAINGKDGSIGLTGPSGANGTISVIDGVPGVDGKDGITRIVIDDIEVATMEDGLKFAGNTGDTIAKKLNETLNIEGELADADDASGANLRVDSDSTKLNLVMAKNLTELDSATFGEPGTNDQFTINKDGVQFVDATGGQRADTPSITSTGIDGGDNQITGVGSGLDGQELADITGDDLNNAVNVGDLQDVSTAGNGGGFGLADASDTEVKQDLGATIKVHDPDGNIVTVADNATGELQLGLSNDLTVGEAGPAGEDGYIGVDGKDGVSGVAINGKDGSIGLTGPSGANGTISVIDGVPGVDGKDGITRIVIDDIEVATMEDGLKFAGNTGDTIAKKLNETLNIEGELADADDASGANLRVDSDSTKLNLVMAKNLTELDSATFGEPGTNDQFTINKDGVQFVDATGDQRADTPSITSTGIDGGDNQITGVGSGLDGQELADITGDDLNNAVNVGDLQDVSTAGNGGGFGLADASDAEVKQDLGATIKVHDPDGNIVTVADNATGELQLGLSNDLTVGEAGPAGEDGYIGVDGKDGVSGVAINGKDGSIGLTGPSGANGTISVIDGVPGVDGKDGITRIVIDDIEVATMEDGLKFAGNTGDTIAKKLNETLNIEGELADADDASGANLRVDSDSTKLNLVMAKNLTELDSATFGEPGTNDQFTINKDGVQFVDATGDQRADTPSITSTGIDGGDNQITGVGSGLDGQELADITGDDLNNAVNVGDLQDVSTAGNGGGFGLADASDAEVKQDLGATIKVHDPDGNIVTVADNATGELQLGLSNDLTVGEAGPAGEDGYIGVDGKDGVSGVAINGKDGSIGLTGPSGANGTISVIDGVPGVDGKDGITRIVIDDIEVATMEDGLKFAGNTGDTIAKKLNETLNIEGELADADDASGANLRVDSDSTKLNLVMAKNLTELDSATFGEPGTNDQFTINKDGVQFVDATGDQRADTPSITSTGIDGGDNQITGVGSGLDGQELADITGDDLNNAVNVGDLQDVSTAGNGGGFGLADASDAEVKQDLGATIKVHDPDGNIVTVADNATGELQLGLSNDLTVGEAGPAGEDGYIGVDGKDGVSGVAINGKDGSIGLTGPSGANGTISVIDGVPGVDGKDGITRIVIDDIEVATMEDGLKFSGNDNPADGFVTRKLNEELQIVGGATATNADGSDSEYSSDNIRTVATQDGGIEIQMAESPTFGGDLTVEGDTYLGDTYLGDNFSVVNNEAIYNVEPDQITNDYSVVNKKYVDNQGDASAGGGFGFADATDTEVKQDLGATIKVHDPDGDITTTADNANGELQLSLSNDLTVGEAGPAGEDGYIGVDGKDGVSGVAINGKDGSIGLTGPAGADGNSPVAIISPANLPGDVVADSTNVTRLTFEDGDGNSKTLATLEDDGLRFSGNDNSGTAEGYVTRRLNEEMQIIGGAKATNADGSDSEYSSDNIRTVATQDGGIEIQLAESPTFGGDLTVEGDTYLGDTYLGDNFSVVNNEAIYNVEPDQITNDYSVVNKKYVDNQGDASAGGGFGFADATDTEVKQDLGATIKVHDPDGDIITTADNANGELQLSLSNDLTVGEAGVDGVDGSIGVNGKDGSSVVLNGKDGTIGLTGPTGSTTIGIDGVNGSNGVDGESITRIVYDDQEVATLNDGLKFSGDENPADGFVTRKLNEELQIVGTGAGTDTAGNPIDYSSGNIKTVATQDGGIQIQFADTPNFQGADMGGEQITNVGSGKTDANGDAVTDIADANPDNAANIGDLQDVSEVANAGWNVQTTGDAEAPELSNVAPSKNVDFVSSDGNVAITHTQDANGDTDVDYRLAANIDLGDEGSVQVGDTIVNNDGLTIAEGPSITNKGIDAGGNKITNVVEGDVSEDSKDAINGSQLYQIINSGDFDTRYVNTNDEGLAESDSFAIGKGSTAVGYEAQSDGENSLALGYQAMAKQYGSVALGANAQVGDAEIANLADDVRAAGNAHFIDLGSEDNAMRYDFAGISPVSTVSVGSVGNERTITNVAAGRITADSTDAINGSQLYAAMDFMGSLDDRLTIVEGDTGGGGADGAVMYDRDDNGDINYDSVTLEGKDGTKLTNVADGDISNDSSDAINGSQLHDTNQNVANNTTNIADNSQRITNNEGNIADNSQRITNNEGNIADNSQRITTNENSITDINETLGLGLNFGADEGDTVNRQLGDTVAITGDDNIATKTTGDGVQVTLNRDLDVDSVTTGNTTVNNEGVSIKDGPSMTINGIDAGGTTITNVAPGVNEGDAVNVGQMNELGRRFQNEIVNVHGRIDSVERNANAGSASAIAASTVPQAWMPGKSMIGVGAGTYGGESAVSVGISRLSDNGRWVIQGKVTGDSQSNFGAGIGAGWHW